MTQSTYFNQVKNVLKVLQGYTKGIRFLLVMFLTLTASAEVWAESVTFSWSGSTTATAGKTDYVVETAPITLTFAAGTAQNAPRTNKEGSVRMYAKTTLTISCTSGNITKVVFTPTSNTYNATKLTYNSNTLTDQWTLSSPAESVTLTATDAARFKTIVVTYTPSGGGDPEPETPATELTDAQFAWSAATAEATMGASNTFPTLTNTVPVSVTYESSNTSTATIAADGTITLVAPGTTTISAIFAGGEVSGTTYAAKTVTYALTVLKAPATPTENMYAKVTDAVTDGKYLIVYEDGKVAFNGALETLDVASNTVEVTISDNVVAGNTEIDAATFTIDAANGTILSASGKYIGGKTSADNGINVSVSALVNSLSIDGEGNAVIISNEKGLRYNKTAGQTRFRFFKDNGGTQEKVQLYKKVDPSEILAPAFSVAAGSY